MVLPKREKTKNQIASLHTFIGKWFGLSRKPFNNCCFCFLFLFICFVGRKQFVSAKFTKPLPAYVLSLTFCGSQTVTNHHKGRFDSMFRFTTINDKYIPSTTLEDNSSSDSNSNTDELAGEIVGVGGERGARRRRWQRRIRRRRLSLSLPAWIRLWSQGRSPRRWSSTSFFLLLLWVSVFLMSEFRALKVSFCFVPLLIWFVFWWQALRSELMAALQKEVKSLDDDAWKFAGPRSQIHRISRPGTLFFLVCQLISLQCCLFFCQSIHQKVSDLNYERDGRGWVLIENHKK